MQKGKGKDLPDWPHWCFLPMAASHAIVEPVLPRAGENQTNDVAIHAAFAAWRVTQGIYRFDPAVYEAVRDTPLNGDIPHEILFQLPEWAIYIETPGMQFGGEALHGSFVHLEHDVNNGRAELRLLLDLDSQLVALPLHLGPWSLLESVQRMETEAGRQAGLAGLSAHFFGANDTSTSKALTAGVEPIASLALYICTQAGQISGLGGKPLRPPPTQTKRGPQYFQADRVMTWDVGLRLGAALRKAYHAEQTGPSSGGAPGPRPHIRRAHWHGFRSGPRLRDDGSEIPASDRPFDLRWLPPIAVNLDDTGSSRCDSKS